MGLPEKCVGYTIECDLTNNTLNISHLDLITKTTQGFNNDVKTIIKYNTPDTTYTGIVQKYMVTRIKKWIQKRY